MLVSLTDVPPDALHLNFAWLSTLHLNPRGEAYEVEGEIMSWAAEHEIAFAIVRPDRYVYAIYKEGNHAKAALINDLSGLDMRLGTK